MERVLVCCEIDAATVEAHAFHFEAHTLLEAAIACAFDLTARAENAVPGKRITASAQHLGDLPVVLRVSCDLGDLAVSGDLAARNSPYSASNRELHFTGRIGTRGLA